MPYIIIFNPFQFYLKLFNGKKVGDILIGFIFVSLQNIILNIRHPEMKIFHDKAFHVFLIIDIFIIINAISFHNFLLSYSSSLFCPWKVFKPYYPFPIIAMRITNIQTSVKLPVEDRFIDIYIC